MNDFNRVAWIYDTLAQVVFGGQLDTMRKTSLKNVLPSSRVLIVGGGTGACLEAIPASCSVDFVEKSPAMITRATHRERNCAVNFICEDFLNWQAEGNYDAIVTPFFLDAFAPNSLERVLAKIASLIGDDGLLCVTDFRHTRRLRHRFLLWVMHAFFRLIARLESGKLLDLHSAVLEKGWQSVDYDLSKSEFAYSATYSRVT